MPYIVSESAIQSLRASFRKFDASILRSSSSGQPARVPKSSNIVFDSFNHPEQFFHFQFRDITVEIHKKRAAVSASRQNAFVYSLYCVHYKPPMFDKFYLHAENDRDFNLFGCFDDLDDAIDAWRRAVEVLVCNV